MNEIHDALRDAVRSLLSRHPPARGLASPEDHDHVLWSRLCREIGAAGLAVPEEYGGAGATIAESQVVLEELGRTLTPSPLLGSAVLATQALLRCADRDTRARLLPGIAAGTSIAALAWTGPAGRWDGTALPCAVSARGRLSGTAHYVLDGDLADVLLVVTPAGLYEVDTDAPGLTRTPVTTMDATRRLAVVRLHDVAGRRLSASVPVEELRSIACAALAAEQVGTAARALELTVEHTKTRVQFGQPIGAFQALQHRLADLYVLVDSARSIAYAAGAAVAAQTPDAPVLASTAKVYCSQALHRVTAEMIQLHGGIAITWEHDAHRYFKRAHGSAQLFGTPGEHLADLAARVLHAAGEAAAPTSDPVGVPRPGEQGVDDLGRLVR